MTTRGPRSVLAHSVWLTCLPALVLVVLVLGFHSIAQKTIKEQNAAALQAVLQTTRLALETWQADERGSANIWASHPQVVETALLLLPGDSEPEPGEQAVAQQALRGLLLPALQAARYRSYEVVAVDGSVVAAGGERIGGVAWLPEAQPERFARVLAGETLFSTLGTSRDLLVSAPIRDQGQVLAVLSFQLDTGASLTGLLQSARIGETGEAYAFTRDGVLLTASRFTAQLQQIGLLQPGEVAARSLLLRDPGVDLTRSNLPPSQAGAWPLTAMAASATQGRSGQDLDGYRDYRGVSVIGAWTWLDEAGFGITVEQDLAESDALLGTLRWALAFLLLVGAGLVATIAHLVSRQRYILLDINARLEDEVSARTQEALQASQARADFLSRMSHEIRTPLHGIVSMIQMMRQEPDAAPELLQRQEGAARLLMSIVNEILDYSKLEAGQLSLETVPFSLRDQLDILPSLHPSAKRDTVALEIVVEPNVPDQLVGDPTRLQQVLINLVSNAFKFTEAGHVRVSCEKRGGGPASVKLLFSVSDTGCGFAPEHAERLFGLFTQEDDSTTRRFGGTGLGLAISRGFVEEMGGRIWARGRPGEGATFSFWLNMPEGLALPIKATVAPSESVLSGLRVLLVEDNELNRFIGASLLRKAGAVVAFAENGTEAIVRIEQEPFDVVLMDGHMPEMDGWSATAHIRETLGRNDLLIIAVTASVLPEDRARSLAVGMDAHLNKPFRLDELEVVIAQEHSGKSTETTASA